MKIGFLIKWPKSGVAGAGWQIIGEELYAESLCKVLATLEGITSAQVYAPNYKPSIKLDIMIHLNDTIPNVSAKKHVLYMQNFYPEGSDNVLKQAQQQGYDGYAFFSHKLLELHQQAGYNGIYLPLAADNTIFKPQHQHPKYEYDVAYVGNDIKGKERTMLYIYPAIHYKFGLFGNWHSPWPPHNHPYRLPFDKLSNGVITREESAVLYSTAKISLNCTGQDSVYWDAINLRFFEVLACKGFLISDKVPSAEQACQDCAVFTDGGEDLINKIDYYLSKPKERQEISEIGYQYVTKHATVEARAKQLHQYLVEL